ncbi:MAG: 3-dehydroquinate synthase [Desulfurococcales archaeon]|nr:3-dehydroquinate synthase [Desulfurococcales archaeon]
MDAAPITVKYELRYSKTATIMVGEGSLERFLVEVAPLHDRVALVVDERVREGLGGIIDKAKWHGVYALKGGESSKSVGKALALWSHLYKDGLGRGSLLVAIGGGSLLDLAGFVASTFMRGVRLALIPTTTLSMADAAVGGKNGVNLGSKNIIGTFYHPDYVVVDPVFLKTMPSDVYLEGFAEVVKHAVIEGEGFLSLIEKNVNGILSRDPEVVMALIERSLRVKMDIVSQDFLESGLRRVLNLGHTLGHAIEAASAYSISHGRSVSMGLSGELRLSARLAGLDPSSADRVERLLSSIGLPTTVPCGFGVNDLMAHIARDKKREGDSVVMPLVERIGLIRLSRVSLGVIEEWLWGYLKKCAQ